MEQVAIAWAAVYRCKRCKSDKQAADFYNRGDGRISTSKCKACVKADRNERFASDPEFKRRFREYNRACQRWPHIKAKREQTERAARDWLWALKSRPCVDCGGTFHPCAMDFDHREPLKKSFTISSQSKRDRSELLAEIEKCDVVCANCHRVRTVVHGRRRIHPNKGKILIP